MEKNQANYVIIGDQENVEYVSVMQTLKDGTEILLLFKVHHHDINNSHSHMFDIAEAIITYGGKNYEGVCEASHRFKGVTIFKGFTRDGHEIEPELNSFLFGLVGGLCEESYYEGMTKLVCDVEKIPYTERNW